MSKNDRQRPTWGWAVMVGLFLAVLVIFNLDEIIQLTRQRHTVVGVFPSGGGALPGTRVWLAGRDIGRVRTVDIESVGPQGRPGLVVRMSVDDAAREYIRLDSEISIGPPSLMADPVVQIGPGTLAAPILEEGDTLRADPPLDLGDLMDRTTEFLVRLDTMLTQAQTLEPPLRIRERMLGRIEANYETAADELESLGDALETGSLQLLTDPDFERRIERLAGTVGALGERIDELLPRLAGDDGARAALARVGERMQGLQTSLDRLRADLDQPNSTLSRLQRDSALAVAVRSVQAQIDSLVAEAAQAGPTFFFGPR